MSETKQDILIVDLDGTLVDNRCELAKYEPSYDEQLKWSPVPVIQSIIELFLSAGLHKVVFLTARHNVPQVRDDTIRWLASNIRGTFASDLICKPVDFEGYNNEYKKEELIKLKEKYNILAYIEDNPYCVQSAKEVGGFTVLQVHGHTFH